MIVKITRKQGEAETMEKMMAHRQADFDRRMKMLRKKDRILTAEITEAETKLVVNNGIRS